MGAKLIPCLPELELKELALDIVNNKVFHSEHLRGEPLGMVRVVFAPLGCGALDSWDLTEVGLFFAYMDTKVATLKGGLPQFSTVFMLNKKDLPVLQKMMDEIRTARRADAQTRN